MKLNVADEPVGARPSPTPSRGRRAATLADAVAAELHEAILRGEYAGGTPLLINELAERFDTSAMPVREALRRLDGLGLIEIRPHRGARVLALSGDDLDDTYRVRLLLEPDAASDAATKMTDQEIDQAAELLRQHEEHLANGRLNEARTTHAEFHFTIYRAARSTWLVKAIEPVWQNSERYRFATGDTDVKRSHAEHEALLNACRNHANEQARNATRAHLEGAHRRLRAALHVQDPTA